MQINIPAPQQQQLAALAALHGFANAEEYARNIVLNAVQAETVPEMTPEELKASVRSIEAGAADVKAGRVQPAREAMAEIAASFGFKPQRWNSHGSYVASRESSDFVYRGQGSEGRKHP